ncbi:hypothetical protein BBJ29_000219 [Phytophthora kernoviae]|uniref:F-box/LRR-repeat protein 15-like leucin rich repeat domain-containing protein n=1 Tax=Phytophthora kernoviae TaxID=325452 RepID=A0A3F2S324_9STRA|nr:hypothetical protein BBP00_00000405 [Phytophthora kernoviae]RLN70694.1 hypothetical protein BBJ29_000219 [Phytophthora kernoviae]
MTDVGTNGFEAVASENLRQIFDFLSLREQFALLSSSKSLLSREPLAPVVTSYCGKCESCVDKNEHLCKQLYKHGSRDFWKAVLRHSTPTGVKNALASLRVLELNRCTLMKAEALGLMADMCGNLRELRFQDMAVDRAALKKLLRNNATTLRVVDLLGCHTVNGEDVRGIAQCSQLRDLSLWGCHNVDNAAIVHVAQHCQLLERLNLRYAHKVDDKVVAAIATHLPQLKDLNLRYCYKVSDKGVLMLCKSMRGLRSLNLSQCTRLTDAAIMHVASSLSRLKELRLWGCTKLTSDAVYFISEGLPELTLLDLRSRDKLETVIGGPTALKFLIQTYRSKLVRWEQAQDEQAGVFKRHAVVAAAA